MSDFKAKMHQIRFPLGLGGAHRAFTCVGWQVTPCDPIWQVTSRSSEMGFPWRAISAFTFFHLCPRPRWQSLQCSPDSI